MSKDTEYLYNCPDCDEFVIDHEWDDHKKGCPGKDRIWLMSDSNLQQLVHDRDLNSYRWENRFTRMRECHAQMIKEWNAAKTGGITSMRYPSGLGGTFRTLIHQASQLEYRASTSIGFLPETMSTYQAEIKLPMWLSGEQAESLCWEQLEAQWPE